jgi:hypothetical protein
MQGKRLEADAPFDLNNHGAYWKNENGWFCITPNGHYGGLNNHDITEHEDKTITISPSILVSDNHGQLWHGYLERGVWREC